MGPRDWRRESVVDLMPYIINPKTGKPQKVTKAQKDAFDGQQSSELLKAFVSSQFGIPTVGVITMVVVGGAFTYFLLSKGWDFSKPFREAWAEFRESLTLEAILKDSPLDISDIAVPPQV